MHAFNESLVTAVTPWQVTETSDTFPDAFTFPAYCGSGVLFYGLDASGTQTLLSGLSAKHIPWFGNAADALYVFHKRMHSTHLFYDDMGDLTQQMPLGYFTFMVAIDGLELYPGILFTRGGDWRRVTDLADGTVATSYTIDRKIRLTVRHAIPMGSTTPCFRFEVESADGRPHKVVIRMQLKPRMRSGAPLWDVAPDTLTSDAAGAVAASGITRRDGAFQAAEDYAMGWGLRMEAGEHRALLRNGRITLDATRALSCGPGLADALECRLCFGTHVTGLASADAIRGELRAGAGFVEVVRASRSYWTAYFGRVASIETGEAATDFLFHRSLQLFDAALALDCGVPPSFQVVAGCPWWGNSSFHDTMYAMRGLLQANAGVEATKLIGWLRDACWQKEERPVYWLTRYDGFPLTKAKGDAAFLTVVAYGLIPVLYAESLGPDAATAQCAYAMLRHIVRYAAAHLLHKVGESYLMTQAVTQDLLPETEEFLSRQDAFMLLGLRPLFRKAHDYALALELDAAERGQWLDIAEHLHVPRDSEGFLLASDGGGRWAWPFCWIPIFCLAPRDPTLPEAQIAQWKEQKGELQAWGQFVAAACAAAWHDGACMQQALDNGIGRGACGTGYFSEFFLEGHQAPAAVGLANLPPFATAHGAYLFAVAECFVRGGIWAPAIEAGPLPGSRYASRAWRVSRIRSLNGALVTMEGDPERIEGTVISTAGKTLRVTILRPASLANESVTFSCGPASQHITAGSPLIFDAPPGVEVAFSIQR